MSRKSVSVPIRWFALVAVLIILSPTESPGAYLFSVGAVSGDDYADAVVGASHAQGDIWGGEQGSDPTIGPDGPVIDDSTPLINTLPIGNKPKPQPAPNGGQIAWLYQLGNLFDWLGGALGLAKL